ncbi:composite domain of metallo-dependent hydrolase [Gigaspora margarita]|uniref:Composite domain of metallo-dependent hydrolase n=1 Tax=Gigaspora margarita TaxID=4874 RepID=A0A8H3XC55_GIGMA|nr:composite domain of metallo-dependent hydrolase [Gigaspora margarita]
MGGDKFNLMGGEAFVIKMRPVDAVSVDDKKQYDCYKINNYEKLNTYFPEDLHLESLMAYDIENFFKHLTYEAAKAYNYVPDEHHSLAAITSVLAKELGLDHQIGQISLEYDADVVV